MDVLAATDGAGQPADRGAVFLHLVAGGKVGKREFVAEGDRLRQRHLPDPVAAADADSAHEIAQRDRHVVVVRDPHRVPAGAVRWPAHSDGPIRVKHSEPCPAASPQVSVPEAKSIREANSASAAASSDMRASSTALASKSS